MTLPFLYLINIVLLTRVPLLLYDTKVSAARVLWAWLLQEAALVAFVPQDTVFRLAVLIFALNLFTWLVEHWGQGRYPAKRLLILALYFVSLMVFCAPFFGLKFRPALAGLIMGMEEFFIPAKYLGTIPWKLFFIYLLGTLLCLNEANLAVRYIIEKLDLRPYQARAAQGIAEYNRGRIIGVCERVVLFFLVLQGQFASFGFVIAAKTMARFKNLDERDFAEYFLIGTMLSLGSAGVIALLTRHVFL